MERFIGLTIIGVCCLCVAYYGAHYLPDLRGLALSLIGSTLGFFCFLKTIPEEDTPPDLPDTIIVESELG